MLLAEDLLLLAYDDESGKQDGFMNLGYGLAGAVLIELAELGKVELDGEGAKSRLHVVDSGSTGNAVLDEWLEKLAKYDGKKPKDAVAGLHRGLDDRLLTALAERGILSREEGKIMGIFPSTRWPTADSSHERHLRQRLRDVLVTGVDPDTRTAALIGLLSGVDAVGHVVDKSERKAAKARAKEIADGNWAADAAQKAIQEMTAAVMTAVVVPIVVSAGSA